MAAKGKKIFISYRREDASDIAGRIRDWLVQTRRIAREDIFMDVTAILPGADFMQVVEQTIGQCRAMIVVISPSWLIQVNAPDTSYVRLEAEIALRHNIEVIPVLVGGARMPPAEQLPEGLRSLTRRNARPVRADSFDYDMDWVRRGLGINPGIRTGWVAAISAVLLVVLSVGILSQGPEDPSNPVWYAFHHATATPTSMLSPSPTPTPNNPYKFQNATLIMADDPMVDNSQGNQWAFYTRTSAVTKLPIGCMFERAGLHCLAPNGDAFPVVPQSPTFASLHNVIFEVKASFTQSHIYGTQHFDKSVYWLAVRDAHGSSYGASFTPDGHYELVVAASNASNILAQGTVSNFQTGNYVLNTIALAIQDNTLSLYVNFQLVNRVTDETISGAGHIDLEADGGPNTEPLTDVTEVVFSHARVWTLP